MLLIGNPRLKPRAGARLNPKHWAGQPAACWLMNEGGGSIRDLSKNANTGALNGGLSWSPSVAGLALSFTAGTQYVAVPDAPSLRFGTSDFTIVATLLGTSTGQQSILDKRLLTGAQTGYTIYATNGLITLQLNDASAAHGYSVGYTGLFNGALNTLAVAISRAANTANFFVNGSLIGTKSIAATGGSLANTTPLTIGASNQQKGGLWPALLASLAIYPFQLTASQAWQLYRRPYDMIFRMRIPRRLGFFPGIDRKATFASTAAAPRFSAAAQSNARYAAAQSAGPAYTAAANQW